MFRDGDASERISFGPFYFILTSDSNHGGTFGEPCDYSRDWEASPFALLSQVHTI